MLINDSVIFMLEFIQIYTLCMAIGLPIIFFESVFKDIKHF